MPKIPIDYSNGLIYSIVCKTDETMLYIGSTTNYTKRKNLHKSTCNNENSEHHNLQVYVMIRANGGWDNFDMKPIKEFPCESKIQLVIEEERIRVEMQAKLNTRRAYRSPEERKEEIKQYQKDNVAKIAEDKKKYREANPAKNAESCKKYREANTAKIAEDKKKYREANAAKVCETEKKYREANKAKINERNRRKYQEKKQRMAEQNKTEK